MGWRRVAVIQTLALCGVEAFFEEMLNSAFGGGGGFQFQMGGDDMFEQRGRRPKKPKFPKGVPSKIDKDMNWLKGTEWNWNRWRNVKFEKSGVFDAPTRECQSEQCIWSAKGGKVFIIWGESGLHELEIVGKIPAEQDQSAMQGLQMKGKRRSDGDRCSATFQKIFDFEAASLDKDLYGILGLPDDAEESDIKKVYRKLSIKYHPDKNPDAESKKMFNDVRDAYEILNDPDKKILYDTGGMEAVKKLEKGDAERGDDVKDTLPVTLEDLYTGVSNTFRIQRRVVCRGCRLRPDSDRCRSCQKCPNEVQTVNQQVGPGMYMQRQVEVQSQEKCKRDNTELEAHVEKGMREGERLTFPRMAEQKPGIIPGDVHMILKQKKHRRFTRQGDDLHMNVQISLRESLVGWKRTIRHLDGHTVEVGTDSVTKPLQVLEVKNEGMPLRDDSSSFGSMFVRIEVVYPSSISKEQHDAIATVFAPEPPKNEL